MRTITTGFRTTLESPANTDPLLLFVTVSHANLGDPVRAVNDIVDYVWQGFTFKGVPFQIELMSDTDRPPSAKVRIQNVSGTDATGVAFNVGGLILGLPSSPRLQLDVLASSDFGDPVSNVRTEIGTPVVEYSSPRMRLRNVRGDAMFVEGELWSYDVTRTPWPATRCTKDRLPGLFR